LFELRTLEIRGSRDGQFILKFDEAISWIQHLNLENVHLEAAENMKFRPNLDDIDPSENFNYVPSSEKLQYHQTLVAFNDDEVEIVPYEVYKQEKLTAEMRMKTISFYGWKGLKVLRIKQCWMDELYWEIFDGLSSLEHLSLEDNGIREISPFTFYGTPNIKSLSLAHNEILDITYRSLAGLLKLQLLDLSYNEIAKLSENTFPPFPNLEILDLRENPIQTIFPSTFGVLNKTEVLQMGSDKVAIEFSTDHPFEHLKNLIVLEISRMNINKLDEDTFISMHNLEVLKIKSGKIPIIEFDTFAKMLNLRELHLTNCEIEEISMDTFLGAKKLEIVDLSFNKIKEIPQGIFEDQHEIVEIYLNDNQLNSLPTDIFKLNSLKMIRLMNNSWNCDCDMRNWRQSVINKIRGGKVDTRKCSGQFKTIHCTPNYVQSYIFDHKMAPKCSSPANVKGKSVFYALRKVIQCGAPPIIRSKTSSQKNIVRQKIINKQKYEKYIRELKKKRIQNTIQYQLKQHGKFEILNEKLNPVQQDDDDISNDL
jgi:Leucine-rich repeat (LRR) protein